MQDIRVASVQFEHVSGDKPKNLGIIAAFTAEAAKQGAEMIVFPECCITGYWFLRNLSRAELESLAEPLFDGPSSVELMGLAKKHNMTVGAGLVELADDGRLFNS